MRWAAVSVGVVALAALAVGIGARGVPKGTLVVDCQGQSVPGSSLEAFAGDYWGNGGVAARLDHPTARSFVDMTAQGYAEFDLPPGIYTVTDNWQPAFCAGLAWVISGKTTRLEGHSGEHGLSSGGPAPTEVAATPRSEGP